MQKNYRQMRMIRVGGRQPLLPVDFNNLGNRIWKLDFRDEGPILSVNSDQKIEKIRELVSKDNKFSCFVYPEVIRQIAYKIITDEEFDIGDESDCWQSRWLKYFNQSLAVFLPSGDLDSLGRSEWCDEVADSFCRKNKLLDLLIN